MTSALFQLSSNGGSSYLSAGTAMADANALAYVSSGTYSIKARLDSTAGVDTATWTITSADEAHAASLPTVTTNADKTCTFSVPKTGGAWLLQCKVNGGQSQGRTDPALTRALAIKVLNSVGNQEIAVGESTEAGVYGWTKAFNDIARASGGGGGSQPAIRQVYYDEGGSAADPVYTTFSTAFTAATALLSEANGPVEIVVLNDNDPPEFPSGTFDAQGLIEIVGKTVVREDRVTVDIQSGFVLKNARALRNLYLEHDVAAPWLTTSTATDLNLVLDNTYLFVNGVSADICTLAASTVNNRLQLINGSRIEGDSGKFTTLASGKAITVYADSGVLNSEVFGGSAGSVAIFQGADASVDTQGSFSGTIGVTSAVITALAQAPTNVAFNSVRLTNVAAPTSGSDAATRTFTLQQGCDLIYDEGGVAGPRTFTTLAAAVTAAASIPGRVRIGIKATSGTPTTTGVTYALDRRIELVGLGATGAFGRVALTMVASAVFQNACAFRNLEIEHDLAAAWLTTSSGGHVVEFDNTTFVDNGCSADIATLGSGTTNFFSFSNNSSFTAAYPLFTLASGKTAYVTLGSGCEIGGDAFQGSAGTLHIYHNGGTFAYGDITFSGTLGAREYSVIKQLADAIGDVSVGGNSVTNVGAVTGASYATRRDFVDGYTSVSVAGSGSISLATTDTDIGVVDLTGALSGDRTVTLPSEDRALWIRNSTTGTYTLCLVNGGGPYVYLAPGQTKRVVTHSTDVFGEALNVLDFVTNLDLSSGYTVATHDVTLFKIPAHTAIDRVEIRCSESLASGTITVAVGVSGSYNQLVTATACSTSGTVVGLDATHAGSDFSGKIAALYTSAQTLTLRIVVSGGTLTDGELSVRVVGHYLG
jgi:hypothetical protein